MRSPTFRLSMAISSVKRFRTVCGYCLKSLLHTVMTAHRSDLHRRSISCLLKARVTSDLAGCTCPARTPLLYRQWSRAGPVLGSHARPLSNYDIYLLAGVLYTVGVWLHIPYGGGHIYSDIPTVFQIRECSGTGLSIPYVSGFIEYPVIVSGFIYLMGVLGGSLPGSIV